MKGKKILQVICKLAWSIVVSYVWLQRNAPVFNGNVKSKIPCFSDVLVNIQEWEDQHKLQNPYLFTLFGAQINFNT
ncbi:hypothetical protein RGQ29_017654 [Quercus rubra]|uniref:Uncharacterized protein n=1 Tax=Quercus rubra TaxID=3512 RepID=A0AAN7FGU3_QUERU|nr:hypothetical protein RGQ29_017654 [Quercus rubra]